MGIPILSYKLQDEAALCIESIRTPLTLCIMLIIKILYSIS